MRCKFGHQQSGQISSQTSSLSNTLAHFRQLIAKKTQTASLVMLLGLGGGLWLTAEAIAPGIVHAYTARVDLTLNRQPNESYETLLRRAEAAARAAAQRSFDQDILATDVAVVVSAQNEGTIVPVISLQVSRPQWRSRPDPQRWATYFTTARSLLRWEDTATTPLPQPGFRGNPSVPPPPPPPGTFIPGQQSVPPPPPNGTRIPGGTGRPGIAPGQPTTIPAPGGTTGRPGIAPGQPVPGTNINTPGQPTTTPTRGGTGTPGSTPGQPVPGTNINTPGQPTTTPTRGGTTGTPGSAPGQSVPGTNINTPGQPTTTPTRGGTTGTPGSTPGQPVPSTNINTPGQPTTTPTRGGTTGTPGSAPAQPVPSTNINTPGPQLNQTPAQPTGTTGTTTTPNQINTPGVNTIPQPSTPTPGNQPGGQNNTLNQQSQGNNLTPGVSSTANPGNQRRTLQAAPRTNGTRINNATPTNRGNIPNNNLLNAPNQNQTPNGNAPTVRVINGSETLNIVIPSSTTPNNASGETEEDLQQLAD